MNIFKRSLLLPFTWIGRFHDEVEIHEIFLELRKLAQDPFFVDGDTDGLIKKILGEFRRMCQYCPPRWQAELTFRFVCFVVDRLPMEDERKLDTVSTLWCIFKEQYRDSWTMLVIKEHNPELWYKLTAGQPWWVRLSIV